MPPIFYWALPGGESGITDVRINERISASRVRLVAQDGEQIGIKTRDEALRIVNELDLDLVELAPNADPPVCRIMDYGKYRYELEQKAKKARKHQTSIIIKEIKFRPKIDPHDYETKKKHVVRFLKAGAKVKVTIMFRGREMAHTELGRTILDRLAADVIELGIVESQAKLDGRNMIMMMGPSPAAIAAKKAAEEAGPIDEADLIEPDVDIDEADVDIDESELDVQDEVETDETEEEQIEEEKSPE